MTLSIPAARVFSAVKSAASPLEITGDLKNQQLRGGDVFSGLSLCVRRGVPPGTIIAWHPRPGDFLANGQSRKLVTPEGWLICNGQQGTPDLTERFVIGTQDPDKIGNATGSESVKPTGTGHFAGYEANEINYPRETGHRDRWSRVDKLDISSISLRPPSVYLVYLMKR